MMATFDTEDVTRLAAGKRASRNQRTRRAMLAKMLRERSESDDAEEANGDE